MKQMQLRNKRTYQNNSKLKEWRSVFLLLFLVLLMIGQLMVIKKYQNYLWVMEHLDYDEVEFRRMEFSPEGFTALKEMCEQSGEDYIKALTLRMIFYRYSLKEEELKEPLPIGDKYIARIYEEDSFLALVNRYRTILSDLRYFPVPVDITKKETVDYENSWMNKRFYGGERFHEGTDVIPSTNVREYYPILSISDGFVEKKGWLPMGGYRIGIRSESGAYFYYAHLSSYAPALEEGDTVKAGQFLGFMGDTGYGKEEGTYGNFAVHLHLGIYLNEKEQEVSVNPYYLLKYLESYKLKYSYDCFQ